MSLRDLFTDTDHVIQTWQDYCDMCDGIEACQISAGRYELCLKCFNPAFRYGYLLEKDRQQARESMA